MGRHTWKHHLLFTAQGQKFPCIQQAFSLFCMSGIAVVSKIDKTARSGAMQSRIEVTDVCVYMYIWFPR